jgi:heme o synthase
MKTITGKSRTVLQIYFELTRSTLSSAIALSAAVGFISYHHGIDAAPLPIFFGVYLLACAASALNQYQESKNDSVMERTKNRPLADHKIKQFSALIIIILNLLPAFL